MRRENFWSPPDEPANDNRRTSDMRDLIVTITIGAFMILGFLLILKPVAVYGAELIEWMERL